MTAREAISASIDGEPAGVEAAELERHLAGCASCAGWSRRAEDVSRRCRVSPAGPIPDLTEAVMASVTGRAALLRRSRLASRLRAALIVVAVAQIGIGIAQFFLPLLGHADHTGGELMAGLGHVERETAAFNVAVGVALLWTALGPSRTVEHLQPLLLTLVTLLALVTAFDLGRGDVGWVRIGTHLPVLLATLAVFGLRRLRPEPRDPDAARSDDMVGPGRGRDDEPYGLTSGFGYGAQPRPPAARTRDVA